MASVLVSTICPAWADVYKSVDAQGHATYSDRPNTAAAQKTTIEVQAANPDEAARLAKEQAILRAEEDQRKQKDLVDSRRKEQQDRAWQAKCDHARTHYNELKDTGRIFRLTADGSRSYYTDAEADALRAQAKQAMSVACAK
jgi:hypothetical protein